MAFIDKSPHNFLRVLIIQGLIWGTIVGGLAWILHVDNIRASEHTILVTNKWRAWTIFRDDHCKINEKSYGIATHNGKFSSIENATTYSCDDGINYTITDRVQASAKECLDPDGSCNVGLSSIPTIK